MQICGGEACKASGWHVVSDISQDLRDVTASATEAGCNRHYFGGPGDTRLSVGPAAPLLECDRQDRPCCSQLPALRNKMTGSSSSLLPWPALLARDGWPPPPATPINAAMRVSNDAMVAA